MKINVPVKINITSLKSVLSVSVDNVIVPELKDAGAVVTGKKENGDKIMIINGDIDIETIESIFNQWDVNIDDYIVDDTAMFPAYDDVETFESKKTVKTNQVNEKKKGCCPPKKVVNESANLVSLSDVVKGSVKKSKTEKLNTVIDSIVGKSLSESVKETAIKKAKSEKDGKYFREKLGNTYDAVMESLNIGKMSIYANKTVNGKSIAEYTIDELRGLLEKVDAKIAKLEEKKSAINESDTAEIKNVDKEILRAMQLRRVLDEEISFRDAVTIKESDGDETPSFEFKNMNPNVEDDDDKKEKKDKKDEKSVQEGDSEESDEEKPEEEESSEDEENADDEKNPDEDEEVELGSIVITLASEDAANDLKNDLVEAGIPEDVLEVEPVEDEEESDEDSEESEDEDSAEDGESSEIEDALDNDSQDSEESNESVKTANGKSINEDDENADEAGEENADDAGSDDENAGNEDENSEEDGESEDKAYKLILTDTDHVDILVDVLENIWGMDKSELEELIGGELVSADSDESDEDSDKDEDSSDDESDSDEETSDDDFDDFDPDEIFKGF